jgi:hypothetical protein
MVVDPDEGGPAPVRNCNYCNTPRHCIVFDHPTTPERRTESFETVGAMAESSLWERETIRAKLASLGNGLWLLKDGFLRL